MLKRNCCLCRTFHLDFLTEMLRQLRELLPKREDVKRLRKDAESAKRLSEKKRKTPNERSESEYRWKKNDYEG